MSLIVGCALGAAGFAVFKHGQTSRALNNNVFAAQIQTPAPLPTPEPATPAATTRDPVVNSAPIERLSYHDGIARVAPSVVSLYSSETIYRAPITDLLQDSINPRIAPSERRATSQGSGVIIGEDGLIVTNNHLVEAADQIYVVLSDGSLHQGKVIGADPETDLAVVRIPAGDFPAAPVADNQQALRVGDIVLAPPGRISCKSMPRSIREILAAH